MFDVLIQHANVYDGTGQPAFIADIGLQSGKIVAIAPKIEASAKTIINAGNLAVCPGFIDIHSHADLTISLLDHPTILEPLLRQGITTFVGGNCGMGPAPLDDTHRHEAIMYVESMQGENIQSNFQWSSVADFLETLDKRGVILNCGYLVPHGMLRIAAKGLQNKRANHDDIKIMKKYLEAGLEAGALGMSTGLMYFPGLNADTPELSALASVVSQYHSVFSSHIRSYSNTLPQAIDEVIHLSRTTNVRVQISHLFHLPHIHPLIDGAARTILRMISVINRYISIPLPDDRHLQSLLANLNQEIQKGLPLGFDTMPTSTGFTHILAFFPPWALTGTRDDMIHRLTDKEERKRIYQSIQHGKSVWPHRDPDTWAMNYFKMMGFRSIHIMSMVTEKNKIYEGMSLHEVGKARGQHPFDAVCDLLIEENGRILIFIAPTFVGDEMIEQFSACSISDPNSSIVTDTILLGFGKPSHLFYDCYPKLLSKYVKKEKRLTLEEAIRKSTSLPAMQMGIKHRGIIQKDYWADLVIFDPKTVDYSSTPEKPDIFPTGIHYVFVNGHPVVTPEGYNSKIRNGHVIRR
ncbi:MAG: amidohydrolase family protein [Candidatus Magnetomorum sp.]|nr:amidohydrolase family protein [Candidatus Magnetomorum sp.]